MGSHEEQDEVMLESLLEAYPKLEFTCIGSEVRNVHQVLASDGTEFPVWIMALRRNEWQITEHYSEKWLIQNGWYDALCERLAAVDMTVEFGNFNNYEHHIRIKCGELTEERHAQLMQILYGAKDDFDAYMPEFMENCGATEVPVVDIWVRFTKNGEHWFEDVPMGSTNASYSSFGPYEYEGYFDHYMRKSEDMP